MSVAEALMRFSVLQSIRKSAWDPYGLDPPGMSFSDYPVCSTLPFVQLSRKKHILS